jgi:hypothetical protein
MMQNSHHHSQAHQAAKKQERLQHAVAAGSGRTSSSAQPATSAAAAAEGKDSNKAQRIYAMLNVGRDWANQLRVSGVEWKEMLRFLILKAIDGDLRTDTSGMHLPSPALDDVWHRHAASSCVSRSVRDDHRRMRLRQEDDHRS